jgi:hypothetical protein
LPRVTVSVGSALCGVERRRPVDSLF